jgi:hypothetical protein
MSNVTALGGTGGRHQRSERNGLLAVAGRIGAVARRMVLICS